MVDASTPEYLRRAAEKCGFLRDKYNESRMPTLESNICVLPFFGDFRASFILSTLVFPQYRKLVKGSKYFIVCSWPGTKDIWPDADEFWSIKDKSVLKRFSASSLGFENEESATLNFVRPLIRHFDEVLDIKDLQKYCDFGLSDDYVNVFKSIRRKLLLVPSSSILGIDFNKALANRLGYKVLVYPTLTAKVLRNNKLQNIKISREFWTSLVDRLIREGFTPVIILNYWTHEMDINEKCLHIFENDISKILSVMRSVDCVLDIFNDISRFAIQARSPYIACIERSKYIQMKYFELDDLCCLKDLPKQYIFSFPQAIENGDTQRWNDTIFDHIISKISRFVPQINRDKLPTTALLEEEVSYKNVRTRKIKRMGVKFIKVEKLL
jgi:hypothetical protein